VSLLDQFFSWTVTAEEPPRWGRRTTEEEKEEMQKEKHTPGKKKKRGRSQIEFDRSPGRYAGRDRPGAAEETGKRCGKSFIAKEDECHQDEPEPGGDSGQEQEDAPKKPRVKKGVPHGRLPKTAEQPGVPGERIQPAGAPGIVDTPENGQGHLIEEGYRSDGTDGIYAVEKGKNPHRIYFPRIIDQAASQYLCSAVADLMKLASHVDYFFKNMASDQVGAGHEMLPFVELDELQLSKIAQKNPDIGGWFVHSVLVRNETPTGPNFDSMVLLKNGRPTILDFGGCLLWQEMGTRRPDGMSPEALPELAGLRSSELDWQSAAVFGKLTDEQVVMSVKKYLAGVEEKDILDLVDASKFAPEDRAEIGKGLIARKRLLESL
jgi:hypothetical protein